MTAWLRCISIAAVLAATGCAGRKPEWREPAYVTDPPPPGARIMLVAGGDDVANFAQEVAQQHRTWRRAGVAASDIACYWAKPTPKALRNDRRQYAQLDDAMAACREASASRVLDDIRTIGESAPPYFYLYVTAHGVPSLAGNAPTWVLPPDERGFLSQHALALDADRSVRVGDTGALLAAYASGEQPRDRIAFTPAALKAALSEFPDTTKKIIVLQGCFSGGFLAGEDSLSTLPNTIVLTAAAASRPSFGCGSGTRETFWGGALGRELEDRVRRGVSPEKVPWAEVHAQVEKRVRKLERSLGQRASRPQFGVGPAR